MAEYSELKKFKTRQANEAQVMHKSLEKILSVVDRDLLLEGDVHGGNPLLQVFILVAEHLQIDIQRITAECEDLETITQIAEETGIKYRQVVLDDNWWKTDSGPLAGFLEENKQPVALLPSGPRSYIMYDPVSAKEIKVDEEAAEKLHSFAFTFYRSFPDRVLGLLDIFKFGLKSCWQSDFGLLLLAGMAGGLLALALPAATGIIYNTVIPESETALVWQIGLLLLVAVTTRSLFQLIRSFVSLRLKINLDVVIQSAVWDRLLRLPVPFFRNYSAGELARKAMSINYVRDLLSDVLISSVLSGIFSVFFYLQMFLYSVKLTMAATLLLLLAVGVTTGLSLLQLRYQKTLLDIENKLAGFIIQMIHGINKIKVAGAEKRLFYQWAGQFSRQRKLTFRVQNFNNYLETFNSGFSILTFMVIFYIMTGLEDRMNIGYFIAFNAAFVALQTAVLSLSGAFIELMGAVPMLENTRAILETIPESHPGKVKPGRLTGRIEVSHLKFRYHRDAPWILDDLSLQIKPGEYAAFIGPSGSGKSTLLRLLLGFEEPESGRIYFDQNDLTKVDIRAVRKQIGVVLQDGELLAGTIYTNIAGNNPEISRKNAWEAAEMAGLAEDINKMPMKMETIINPGQLTLSGGQKQRLLIARAVAKKPRILFFDEATSALDNKTQAQVTDCLDKLQATRIVIAHRLSTIKQCDRIFVLADGRIREEGSYEELLAREGIFTALAKRQLA